jgi:chromosomal replication initiation ATPase DnaA
MYLAKEVAGWSTTRIGKFYNGRHHTTVCHSIKHITILRQENVKVDALVAWLTK